MSGVGGPRTGPPRLRSSTSHAHQCAPWGSQDRFEQGIFGINAEAGAVWMRPPMSLMSLRICFWVSSILQLSTAVHLTAHSQVYDVARHTRRCRRSIHCLPLTCHVKTVASARRHQNMFKRNSNTYQHDHAQYTQQQPSCSLMVTSRIQQGSFLKFSRHHHLIPTSSRLQKVHSHINSPSTTNDGHLDHAFSATGWLAF